MRKFFFPIKTTQEFLHEFPVYLYYVYFLCLLQLLMYLLERVFLIHLPFFQSGSEIILYGGLFGATVRLHRFYRIQKREARAEKLEQDKDGKKE